MITIIINHSNYVYKDSEPETALEKLSGGFDPMVKLDLGGQEDLGELLSEVGSVGDWRSA